MSIEDYSKVGRLPLNPMEAASSQASTNSVSETTLEVINLTRHTSDRSQTPRVFRTPKAFQKELGHDNPFGSYGLVIIRDFKLNSDGKPIFHKEVLKINDPSIRHAMKDVLLDYPFIDLHSNPIELKAPFRELFYFYEDLLKYSQRSDLPQRDSTAMRFFVNFINERLEESIKKQSDLFQRGEMTYELLWTIYRPGAIVFSEDQNRKNCFVIRQFTAPILECYRWGYKGGYLGRVDVKLCQDRFRGALPIEDLVAIPLEFLAGDQQDSIRSTLIERGRKWLGLIGTCHRSYDGDATKLTKVKQKPEPFMLYAKEDTYEYHRSKLNVNGRVMLDSIKLEQYHPGALADLCKDLTIPRKELRRDGAEIFRKVKYKPGMILSNTQALICPSTTYGYSLQNNVWAEFQVELVQGITYDSMCFSTLQIDNERKRTLLSLINSHERTQSTFRDNTFQKGLGRIFLFHGPPGCGKTLTAEVIAEHLERPLYRITTGQLGIDAPVVEAELSEVLDLAQSWRAVLLLDEADVFLAARTTENLARNAIVSVFLRLLEYYKGIMILTTNRLRDFDSAFRSRIHVDLRYDIPDEACRSAIWKDLFDMNKTQAAITSEERARLGKNFVLNGRDIKNLFTTALAMAGSDESGAKVGYEEIETLYRINSRHEKPLLRKSSAVDVGEDV